MFCFEDEEEVDKDQPYLNVSRMLTHVTDSASGSRRQVDAHFVTAIWVISWDIDEGGGNRC